MQSSSVLPITTVRTVNHIMNISALVETAHMHLAAGDEDAESTITK